MAKDIPLNERIIFALDVSTNEEAKQWVQTLESHIRFFKVGLQLFLAGWFDIIAWIRDGDLLAHFLLNTATMFCQKKHEF